MRWWRTVRKDIRLQFRHGFYFVYLVMCALYIGILYVVKSPAREVLHSIFIFIDPSTMGYIFIGGIVLLERHERSLSAVFVTPISIQEYLVSKVLSINVLSLSASLLITLLVKGIQFNLLLMIWAVSITSPVFTLLGLALSTRFKSLNAMLMVTGLAAAVINIPMLGYWPRFFHPVLEAFPPLASLKLIDMALGHVSWSLASFSLHSGILLLWGVVMYTWAHRWFKKYLVSQAGVKV